MKMLFCFFIVQLKTRYQYNILISSHKIIESLKLSVISIYFVVRWYIFTSRKYLYSDLLRNDGEGKRKMFGIRREKKKKVDKVLDISTIQKGKDYLVKKNTRIIIGRVKIENKRVIKVEYYTHTHIYTHSLSFFYLSFYLTAPQE